jgi:hypothetical protein
MSTDFTLCCVVLCFFCCVVPCYVLVLSCIVLFHSFVSLLFSIILLHSYPVVSDPVGLCCVTVAQADFLRLRNGSQAGSSEVLEKRRNACLLFIKPHANTPEVRDMTLDLLRSQGFVISEERLISAQYIDQDLLIDKQYANIAKMALFLSPKDYQLSPKSYIHFQKKFGSSWSDEIANRTICNANEIVLKLEITHSQLNKAWTRCIQQGNFVKLEREFYCGYIDTIPHKAPMFCINGFYMAMRAQYLTPSASIQCYTVEWEDDVMSWKSFLRDVIGNTDPREAKEESLRGQITRQWMELQVKAPLDIQNNAIHASSSAFEAMVERSIWFKQSLKGDPLFGKRLIAAGVPSKTLREWANNSIIRESRLFDHMNNLGADDCIDKALELLKTNPLTSTALQIIPKKGMSQVTGTPHLPAIQSKAAAQSQSGSKCLNRRLFERALAQDYKEFAGQESAGYGGGGKPETQHYTQQMNTQQQYPQQLFSQQPMMNNAQQQQQLQYEQQQQQSYQHIQVTQRKVSYQKMTSYSDSNSKPNEFWNTKHSDRYINETSSMHDSEEANVSDQPATSHQSRNNSFVNANGNGEGADGGPEGPSLDQVTASNVATLYEI